MLYSILLLWSVKITMSTREHNYFLAKLLLLGPGVEACGIERACPAEHMKVDLTQKNHLACAQFIGFNWLWNSPESFASNKIIPTNANWLTTTFARDLDEV